MCDPHSHCCQNRYGDVWDNFGVGSYLGIFYTDTDWGRPSQPLDQPHIFNVVSRPTDWAARINGVILSARNTNSVGFGGTNNYRLGSDANGANCFVGQIAEVLIFSRGLTPAERFDVGTYLNWRYNLVTNAPATPTNLTAFAVGSSQIALAWSSALTNVGVSFHVQRGANDGSFTDVAVLDNATSYLDTNLVAGTEYFYRVMAANYAGVSGCSAETNVTTMTNGTAIPLDALKVWLKADSGHGGNPISCWVDQTTNGNHACYPLDTCGTGGRWQPMSVQTNGQPAIYWGGTNALYLPRFATGWTEGEAFVVLKSLGPRATDPSSGLTGLWIMGPGMSLYPTRNNTGGCRCTTGPTNIWENFGHASGADVNTVRTAVDAGALQKQHCYNVMSKDNSWTNWLNTAVLCWTTNNLADFDLPPATANLLGASGEAPFWGYMWEVMIFNRVLNNDERNAVNNYLNNRYNLY